MTGILVAEVLITPVKPVGYQLAEYNKLNPTSLHSRDCKLITLGHEMGVLAHTSIYLGDCLALNTDAMRTPGIPMQGTLCIITLPDRYNPALYTNLEHLA